jgi:geranylgeranyl pyrophosphate synthase
MVYQMAMAYGLESAHATELAIALEYFHTASLIFDDLPCMDNASERRGAPCVHLAYGESGAILTALALINRAYALCWRAASESSQSCQSRALAYIEQCLGVTGLLNGQSLDLHYSSLPHSRETTELIARGKTVSLIRLTLVMPAILGNASTREIQLLERIALYWGLSYQMVDDLKDILLSSTDTGKTVARDVLLDHPNIATAIGVSRTVELLNRYLRLGDISLRGLLLSSSSMSFLEKLRESLQELMRVNHSVHAITAGERE